MRRTKPLYKGHRFPPDVIQYAAQLYHQFNPSRRDIEDLLSKRGVTVSYEYIRLWCNKFRPRTLFFKGVNSKHVAAFLVEQVVYMFKESGCPDENVGDIVEKTLKQFPD